MRFYGLVDDFSHVFNFIIKGKCVVDSILLCIASPMCTKRGGQPDTHCLLRTCGILHASMLGFVLLLQCRTLKVKCNFTMRTLPVHIVVLKSASAATIMTYGIVHQRVIMDAYNAYV